MISITDSNHEEVVKVVPSSVKITPLFVGKNQIDNEVIVDLLGEVPECIGDKSEVIPYWVPLKVKYLPPPTVKTGLL